MDSSPDAVPILVIEDRQDQARSIEEMLGGDFAVTRVSTLADAIEAVEGGSRFGCVVLDPLLPGTEPLETLEAIDSLAPDAPIVVLADTAEGRLANEVMKVGVQDVLPKGAIDRESLRGSVIYAIERKRGQLAHDALHDPLTGLPNRTLFRDRCLLALTRIGRASAGVGVLFIDLDGFKQVNDSLGHRAGDRLLQLASDRILHCVRTGDTVSRIGGDEFTVLGVDLGSRQGAAGLAERISRVFAEPFDLGGREVPLTCSIGIAFTNKPESDPDELIQEADIAMYHAKKNGGSRSAIFGRSLRARTAKRRQLEMELGRALDEDQLKVVYQPQVELVTGRMTGLEALARWQHPERGLVPASEFIRVAEETGLIHRLGHSVLEQACRDYAEWLRSGAVDQGVQLSVNLSPRQLAGDEITAATGEVLAETGVDPRCLCLEITESGIVSNAARAGGVLKRLKALGVCIAMDDFGVGYASLGYLERLPIDSIKIDRSLVGGVAEDARKQRVVATVVALAETLGLRVVAEGIELPEDAEQLIALGCQFGQGYLFARPTEAPVLFATAGGGARSGRK
jgi:diguanylate cyclase (GGDEF)-like protein